MHLFNFVSIKLTLCLIIGILMGFHLTIAPHLPLLGLLAVLPLWYSTYRKSSYKRFPYFEMSTYLVTILVGVFAIRMALFQTIIPSDNQNSLATEQFWQLKIDEVLKPNRYTRRYVAKVVAINQRESIGKVLLSFPIDTTNVPLRVDDEIMTLAVAKAVQPPSNPHQFDYSAYLQRQGIYYEIYTHFEAIHRVVSPSRTLKGLAANYRDQLITQLEKEAFGKEEFPIIQALLLGQREDISAETYRAYRDAGALHILAVSGLHIGILLLLLHSLLWPLKHLPGGNTLKLIVIVGLLWAYAFVAGLSPSVVRAVTMFSFLAYAMCLNRPTNTFNIIALSLLFMLLINPLFLFQVGFQMSYAAVFAIVWIYPKLQRLWWPHHILLRKIWQLLSVSLAAQLGVLPISLFYFHQFPGLFFVANLLVIPFLGLILGTGIFVLVLSQMGVLPSFLVTGYNAVLQAMNAVVRWVAEQKGFVVEDISFDMLQLVLSYCIILAMIVWFSQPKWKKIVAFLGGIIALQGWMLSQQWILRYKEAFFLAHTTKNTMLVHQIGSHATLYTKDTTRLHQMVQTFKVAERLESISIQNVAKGYCIDNKRLYVMGHQGMYPSEDKVDFLLLTQSPKINLERLINKLQPKKVFADGSNYKSTVARWKKTCEAKSIPFYDTAETGAFYFDL